MAGTWSGGTFNGDSSDDVAVGTGAAEVLFGNGGNDSLDGAGGRDVLDGGVGDDTLLGGLGNDFFTLGFGNDIARGGNGNDRFDIGTSDGGLTRISGGAGPADVVSWGFLTFFALGGPIRIVGDLAAGARVFVNGQLVARLDGIEALEVAGTFGDDSFLGGVGGDVIGVLMGSDTVRTGLGDDGVTFSVGDGGLDIIDLGAGTLNSATILGASNGDVVFDGSLSASGATSVLKVGGAVSARITGAERFAISTGSGDDTITLGDADDVVSTVDGAKRIETLGGDDIVTLFVDDQKDIVDGGTGSDALLLEAAFDPIDMRGTAGAAVKVKMNGAVVVTGASFEQLSVVGSGGNDTLIGADGEDSLKGAGGADLIRGAGGKDNIEGGQDADSLYGGTGPDAFLFLDGPLGDIDTVFDLGRLDRLYIDISKFGGDPSDPVQLVVGSAPGAENGDATFLFDLDTGLLSFDGDGTGAGGVSGIVMLLNGGIPAVVDATQLNLF